MDVAEKILDVEMIRDGGSFLATIVDDSNTKYYLFTKVVIDIKKDNRWLRTKYENPVFSKTVFGNDIAVTWDEGLSMLNANSNEITHEISKKWHQNMIDIFKLNGKVPEYIMWVGESA